MPESLLAWLLDATRPVLVPAFTLWGSPVTWAELLAFGLALGMVAANLRVNPRGWPLEIASSVLYGLLFADARLYGEAGLQGVFIALALWGWWQWLRGTADGGAPLVVHSLSHAQRAIALAATLAGWGVLGLLLDHGTDSPVPWFDALPTAASITGQVLLARKVVDNWPTWLAVNVVSVALFAYKALWLTALLYALFALLSVVGWSAGRRLERGHG